MSIGDKNLLKCLWLDPTILNWKAEPVSDRDEEANWKRPYEIWSHAESLLQGDPSNFKRTDALTTLKRAVDRRVRQLSALHDLKGIPIPEKPSGPLELLEYVGLIRPIMLQRLIAIRNVIEHKDTPPPTVEELRIFLEFAWYFLRSTDNALRHPLKQFSLQPGDPREFSPYWLEVTLGPDTSWLPKIRGWVEPCMLSTEQEHRWISINMIETVTRRQVLEKTPKSREVIERWLKTTKLGQLLENQRGEKPEDILLVGEVRGPKEAILQLVRISLRLI